MRSVRFALLIAIGASAAGCALLPETLKSPALVVVAQPASQAAASATASSPVVAPGSSAAPAWIAVPAPTAAPSQADAEPPVSPAAQRAFDDARRLLAVGRMEEAERGFQALAKSHPELGGPHANLGLIHRRAGKLAEAVAALEQAVRARPKQPLYLNQLGIAYREHGQFDKARDAYEKAIALDPGYAAPLLNLGILHDLYLRDGKQAIELYDRYLAMSTAKDATVSKWVADLKNRRPENTLLSKKEQP